MSAINAKRPKNMSLPLLILLLVRAMPKTYCRENINVKKRRFMDFSKF